MDRNRMFKRNTPAGVRNYSQNFCNLNPNMTVFSDTKKSDSNQIFIDKSLLNTFNNMEDPLKRNLGEMFEKNTKQNKEQEIMGEKIHKASNLAEKNTKMEFHIFSGFTSFVSSIFSNIANVMFQSKQEDLNSDYSYDYFDADTMFSDDIATSFENDNGAGDKFKNRTLQQDLNLFQNQFNPSTVTNCTSLCERENEKCESIDEKNEMMNATVECRTSVEQCETKLCKIKEILVTKKVPPTDKKVKSNRLKKVFIDSKNIQIENEKIEYDDNVSHIGSVIETEFINPAQITPNNLVQAESLPCIKIEKSEICVEKSEQVSENDPCSLSNHITMKFKSESSENSIESITEKNVETIECVSIINQDEIDSVNRSMPINCCQIDQDAIHEENNTTIIHLQQEVTNHCDNTVEINNKNNNSQTIQLGQDKVEHNVDNVTKDENKEIDTTITDTLNINRVDSESKTTIIERELDESIIQAKVEGKETVAASKSNDSSVKVKNGLSKVVPISQNGPISIEKSTSASCSASRCEDKIKALTQLLQKRSNKWNDKHNDSDEYLNDYIDEPDCRYPKTNKYSKKQRNPSKLDIKKPKPKTLRKNIDDMCFGGEITTNLLSHNGSPTINIVKPAEKNSFDEIKGRFHDNGEADDSFVIVFSDSPQEKQRIPSECGSEDSFIICFEDEPNKGDCYTSTDVFGNHSGSSDLESELSDLEPEPISSKAHLSRTISDLTDESLYVDEPDNIQDENVESIDIAQESYCKGILREKRSPSKQANKTVHFDDKPPKVHLMRVWTFAARQARKGPWERMVVDRERFRKRIADADMALSWVLKPQHRNRVKFQRFMPWWHAQRRKELAEKKERERLEKERLEKIELERKEEEERLKNEIDETVSNLGEIIENNEKLDSEDKKDMLGEVITNLDNSKSLVVTVTTT